MLRRLALGLSLLAPALLAAGCGDDDFGQDRPIPTDIAATVEDAATDAALDAAGDAGRTDAGRTDAGHTDASATPADLALDGG